MAAYMPSAQACNPKLGTPSNIRRPLGGAATDRRPTPTLVYSRAILLAASAQKMKANRPKRKKKSLTLVSRPVMDLPSPRFHTPARRAESRQTMVLDEISRGLQVEDFRAWLRVRPVYDSKTYDSGVSVSTASKKPQVLQRVASSQPSSAQSAL